jgi:isopentenyl diphosphate isomerase/L-lactate dehydrogenase-like FMN-dependent dehydrogenase
MHGKAMKRHEFTAISAAALTAARQLDGAPSSISMLLRIAETVGFQIKPGPGKT